MPRVAFERGPRWTVLGEQIRGARLARDWLQSEVGARIGYNQAVVSRDERGLGMPDERVLAYCKLFEWDHAKVTRFLEGTEDLPDVARARQEYYDLFTLLDGQLRDGEEQDLLDEAIQLVILHRYPHLSPADFVSKDPSPDAG